MAQWTVQDSDEIYNVSRWGGGFFSIGESGNIVATPRGPDGGSVDLRELIDDLKNRGIHTPVLLRFSDILGCRIRTIAGAFSNAINEYNYQGEYRLIAPIKVNQQRHVLEELIKQGHEYHLGLEAGSKPELLAAIGMMDDPDSLLICNGYKDTDYLETAILSCKLGFKTVVICDRFREIENLIELSQRGLSGFIGVRCKLAAKGAGRWAESGGDTSKFGLTASEIVTAVDQLGKQDMLDQLVCLHFHIGSQITAIRAVKSAINEASRIFVDLYRMGATNLKYIDVGGGLAVDYDGSQTNFESSMNYTVNEYAADIVSTIATICDEAEVPHPTILSESGRALVAHHAVLVTDVLDVNEVTARKSRKPTVSKDDHEMLRELADIRANISKKNFQESYHDALHVVEQLRNLFSLGYLTMRERALSEELLHDISQKIDKLTKELDYVPDDMEKLHRKMYDTYYCNFSVFQSVPDHWAVGALFPVVPIQQLDEKPDRRGILADLTCDSDGKICKFIDLQDVGSTLPLHAFRGGPYYIGIFLVGAYQETLGDLHNLFGDTQAVHVSVDEFGRYNIHHHVIGDSVADVLGYVEFDTRELVRRVRMATEAALKSGRMTFDEVRVLMRRYEAGLTGYTYLAAEGSS